MSLRVLLVGGFGASAAGATIAAGLMAFFLPEASVMMSAATIGAILGSGAGWQLIVRPAYRAAPARRDAMS
jgi:Na+/glutamate symporter